MCLIDKGGLKELSEARKSGCSFLLRYCEASRSEVVGTAQLHIEAELGLPKRV